MLRADKFDPDRAFVLVIDLQEKLLPLIRRQDRVIEACAKLLDGVRILDLPVLATEQYAKGLGPTHAAIRKRLEACGARFVEKSTLSACGEPAVRKAMLAMDRPQVAVVGIEAHVCVQQTVLDLRTMDYDVFVCADAIGSRGRLDYEISLDRMRQGGALVTTVESVLFELHDRCDTKTFKALLEVIKASPPPVDD